MIATAVREMFLAASLEHQFQYQGQETVCTWIAYLYNWTGILRFVYTVGVMVYLSILVWYLAKGNTMPQFLHSKFRRVSLEVLYVVLSLALTFVYASGPYFTGNYGLAGPWCWINSMDKKCDMILSGLLSQIFTGYLFFVSNGIIGLILTIAVAVVYCKLPATLQESQLLLKKTFFVMVCFFLYVIIQVFAFSVRMSTAEVTDYENFALWFTFSITYPISLTLFPIGFFFSFYPVSKLCGLVLCWRALRSIKTMCCKKWSNRRSVHFQEQPATFSTCNVPSIMNSTRVSPPSSTFFHVPYTDAFTQHVTETAQLVGTDTGYGSISHQ